MSDEQGQADVPEPKPGWGIGDAQLNWGISDAQLAKFHWGAPISKERQDKLKGLAERQREWAAQPTETRRDSVFAVVRLTGADVSWLAADSGRDTFGRVPNLHLETLYCQPLG